MFFSGFLKLTSKGYRHTFFKQATVVGAKFLSNGCKTSFRRSKATAMNFREFGVRAVGLTAIMAKACESSSRGKGQGGIVAEDTQLSNGVWLSIAISRYPPCFYALCRGEDRAIVCSDVGGTSFFSFSDQRIPSFLQGTVGNLRESSRGNQHIMN